MGGMGPVPQPNRRRRNSDTLTGDRRAPCAECGTPKYESQPCRACGSPGSSGPISRGPTTEQSGATPGDARIPELPNPKRWLTATREWWDAWTRSAQTTVFEPSDWETLKALLPLVDAMHRESGDPLKRAKLFETVHRAEKGLGGTHMERLRGRVDSANPTPGTAANGRAQANTGGQTPEGVAVLDEYRGMVE